MAETEATRRCSPNALGIAVGILWALYVFSCGIIAIFGWGAELVSVLSSLYLGYSASFIGAVIGALWAFADGYFAGLIIGWIYNRVAR